ncbi:MAG: hypothetical protein EXR71_12015 [Myxococcales bacterium]|nr:hypothetical protein [Myxococcales bacterium]
MYLLFALACSTPDAVVSPPSSPVATAPSPDGGFANIGPARVVEAVHGDGRSYLHIEEAGYDFWVSVPKLQVKVEDRVLLGQGPLQATLTSAELAREFKPITVIEAVRVAAPDEAAGALAPLEGGVSVGDVYARKAELAGKVVKVRGRVVKANKGIFGKNWYHLRDGTGAEETNDLTVTGLADAEVGDTIVAQAPLTLDRDLGFGYFFSVILEDAEITVDGASAPAPADHAPAPPTPPAGPAPAGVAPPEGGAPAAGVSGPVPTVAAPVAAPAVVTRLTGPVDSTLPRAPSRSFLGLEIGAASGPALDAWLADKKLVCETDPASRRATVRTQCEKDVPVGILEGRTVSGKVTQMLFSRGDDGPIHYAATSRRYSLPKDAVLDFESTMTTLSTLFGAPPRVKPVDVARLDGKVVRFSADWTFADLDVSLSLFRAGTAYWSVNESWSVPGVEAGMKPRPGSRGHGDVASRPEGWNPHVVTGP